MHAGTAVRARRSVVCFGLALAAGALSISACGDSTDSGTASLRATLATTGPNAGATYLVSVDGGESKALTASSPVTFDGLTPGSHSILLTGIAPNCTVSGPNPVVVTIGHGTTKNVTFSVSCLAAPTSASLRVTTFTSGAGDPGTFTLGIDSSAAGYAQTVSVLANGATSINLPAGTHRVTLAVPLNCAVTGTSSASVTTAPGSTATLHFDVTCATGAPLRIRTTTTGPGAPATYLVGVDGGAAGFAQSATIAASGEVSLTLPAGEHTVTLVTPLSCTVANSSTASVTVVTGALAEVSFTVTCTLPGKLRVTVGTTGSNRDTSYAVRVDGSAPVPILTGSSITFDSVGTGNHAVELLNLDANCTVSGPNPATVAIAAGATTNLSFAVACIGYGSLRMTVATTGGDIPPTFSVVIDPDYLSPAVPSNGAASVTLPPGPHTVTLYVPANCTVTSPNSVAVTVPSGIVTDVAFTVTCVTNGVLRVTVTTTGVSAPGTYLVEVDPDFEGFGFSFGVAPNGATTQAVSPGPHTVRLSVVAGCQVTSANDVPVSVASGATVDVAFAVTCVPNGTLHLTAGTTGPNAPPTYVVTLYYDYIDAVLPANGEVFIALTPGRRTVSINIPGNCTGSPSSATVDITSEATTDVTFTVACQ